MIDITKPGISGAYNILAILPTSQHGDTKTLIYFLHHESAKYFPVNSSLEL